VARGFAHDFVARAIEKPLLMAMRWKSEPLLFAGYMYVLLPDACPTHVDHRFRSACEIELKDTSKRQAGHHSE